jgi:hypothetical protein
MDGTASSLLPEENLLGFQRMFPDEAACVRYLVQLRWPGGFMCPACGRPGEPQRLTGRGRVLRCRLCRHETSVTGGTAMHRSKTDLHVWFWAAFLVATSTPGVSALEIQKKLGLLRYETAFQLMHKLRAAMVRPNQDKIGGEWPVEMDAWLPIVSTVTGNLKAWIDGTFHGVSRKHLQTYLNEFMFRFNRRFWRQVSFRKLLGLAAAQAGPTYRGIYDGKWTQRADSAAPAAADGAPGVATG